MSEVDARLPSMTDVDARLAALDDCSILDTPAEQGFDDLTLLASRICDTPVALVSLVDRDRQWFKARIGFPDCETDLGKSVCKFVLGEPDVLVIPDLTLDPRTEANPLVTGEMAIRFYAGAPLRTPEGVAVGSLCVIDTEPRPAGLTEVQRETLRALARQVSMLLDLRRRSAVQTRMAEVMRDSEARYRALFENIDAGFCIAEAKFGEDGRPVDHRVLEVNPAFERHTGLSNVVGGWASELAPGIEQEWHAAYGHVARTGEPLRFEREAKPLGRWYEAHLFPTGTPGNHVGMLIVDTTQRQRAAAQLIDVNATLEQRVEERTRERDHAWKHSRDLQVVVGSDGTMVAANDAWLTVLGWTADEVVGRNHLAFNHPDHHADSSQALERSTSGELPAFETRCLHKDGSVRWISWVAAPEGGLVYASGRNVTAEKEQAEALQAAEDALRQSQKMEAVGQLTGGLAHDFNNLLAGISGSLELMQTRMQQGRFQDVERYMAAAQGASKRAAALTHRLLAFSRRQTLDPKPTDVNRLANGMQDMIQRTVGPGIAVEVVGAGGCWPTLVDPSQLENALLNLCINARDAMPDGGRITVETANTWMDERAACQRDVPAGQYLGVSVTDTGTGMPPEVIARVFEPFYTTKPIGEGTGLGLSMVYGFARQSGGQVRIHSQVGQGTTVSIYLPRHHGEAATDDTTAAVVALPRSEQGETVLVVDDEPTVRMLVTDILEDLGYTAIEAGDSAAGLKVLQSDVRIDLLITDVGLPGGMNGRQMADAGRTHRPELRVLFITGYAKNAIFGNGQLAPGMAVLTKPFAVDAMATRIRSMIEGSRGQARRS